MDSQQVKTVLKGTLHHDTEIVKEQWCCGRLTNGKGVTEADQAYVCMYVPDLCKPCHAPKIQLNNPSPHPTKPWPGQSTTAQLLTTCPFYRTAQGGCKTEQREEINRWMTKKRSDLTSVCTIAGRCVRSILTVWNMSTTPS